MNISNVARSYARMIKLGKRNFNALSDEVYDENYPSMKAQVRQLLREDVYNKIITVNKYEKLTGETYTV